ncbi:leucine--tRNA ligase [Trichonephila clavipes]|nr:leucine--tRNA ligase [Trichonephila clavipes]
MVKRKIILHNDLSSLHKSFPPSILPKEYGGTIPLREMTARWIEVLDSRRDQMLALDEMRVDESKRPKDKHARRILPRLVNSISRMEIY